MMREFELPPSVDVVAENNIKEISWSATPGEIDQEMIEKQKKSHIYINRCDNGGQGRFKGDLLSVQGHWLQATTLCFVFQSFYDHSYRRQFRQNPSKRISKSFPS